MRASRSISVSLIISFIAVLMSGDLFTEEAAADCGRLTIVSQIGLGYLAGGAAFGAAFIAACTIPIEEEEWASESGQGCFGIAIAAIPTTYLLVSARTVYIIGQKAGCRGSFIWTLGGAVASPIVGGVIGGILGENLALMGEEGILVGGLYGFLLAPISATIAYHLTKGKNNSGKKEIVVPLMSMRF